MSCSSGAKGAAAAADGRRPRHFHEKPIKTALAHANMCCIRIVQTLSAELLQKYAILLAAARGNRFANRPPTLLARELESCSLSLATRKRCAHLRGEKDSGTRGHFQTVCVS
jgi:hypothetical protein